MTAHPASILDVGCGAGVGTDEIGQRIRNAKLFGVDVSTWLVERAGQAFSGRYELTVADFMRESWDAVPSTEAAVLRDVLCHVSDKRRFLQRVGDNLPSRGRLVIFMTSDRAMCAQIFRGQGAKPQEYSEY